jgi:CBS-domain-containing membrane protein
MVHICERHVHRIVVVDEGRKVVGIVSLADLLAFLLALGSFSPAPTLTTI